MLGTFSMGALADDEKVAVTLPTLTVLAEPELSNETGYVPFVQEEKTQRALQHQVMRSSKEAQQSYGINRLSTLTVILSTFT